MASRRRPPEPAVVRTEVGQDGFYLIKKEGERVLLTNFTARIIEDIVHEGGEAGGMPRRSFTIRAQVAGGKAVRFTISQKEFESMKWVAPHLGARAIIYTVRGSSPTKVRHAIQEQSRRIRSRTAYDHIGWQQVGSRWLYLHADGAIGSRGPVQGLTVMPPEGIANFKLPVVRDDWARMDVGTSLAFLYTAPDAITLPLYAAIWRSILGRTSFSIHICGKTGNRKTQLACLMQQHFGAAFDDKHLPASFIGTPHSLVQATNLACDAILVVDDYVPSTPGAQGKEMRESANRLFRALGNTAGRSRLGGSGLRAETPPRCLLITTGEDLPDGLSIRGRILFVLVGDKQVRLRELTACQEGGREGYFARAMAHYVRWMAPRYGRMIAELPERIDARRREFRQFTAHPRTPDILANIDIGMEDFTRFAVDVRALSRPAADQLRERLRAVLPDLAAMQRRIIVEADPAARFLPLVGAAVRGGDAHLAARGGGPPPEPTTAGWVSSGTSLAPQGPCVGWVEGSDLYLDQDAAYQAAVRHAERTGEAFRMDLLKLNKRLNQQGLLASVDENRGTLTVRRMILGTRREVLHVAMENLGSATAPPQTT